MSGRIAARYISRRFSSGGKVFSEEEKAAEKNEKEKLEKLARQKPLPLSIMLNCSTFTLASACISRRSECICQGPKPAQATGLGAKATATERKPSGLDRSTPTDSSYKLQNYVTIAGFLTGYGIVKFLINSGSKETKEVQD